MEKIEWKAVFRQSFIGLEESEGSIRWEEKKKI